MWSATNATILSMTSLHVERHKRNNFVNDVLAFGVFQQPGQCHIVQNDALVILRFKAKVIKSRLR
jgi:hypothetical protein